MSRIHRIAGMTLIWLSTLGIAHGQPEPTYSIDYQGPPIGAPDSTYGVAIKEGDILVTPFGLPFPGPTPPPGIGQFGGPRPPLLPNLGLPADPLFPFHPPGVAPGFPGPGAVELDAHSYGTDLRILGIRTYLVSITFSVDEFSIGVAGTPAAPNVSTEGALGTDEASADVYVMFPGLMPGMPFPAPIGAIPPGNTMLFDGNGLAPPAAIIPPFPFAPAPGGLGLTEPNPPGPGLPDAGTNLDSLDIDGEGFIAPFAVYFSLDTIFPDPVDGPPGPPPNTNSAFNNGGFVGGDVLATFFGFLGLFAPAGALGLDLVGGPNSDDLDALALAENGTTIYEASVVPLDWEDGSTDMLLFSVRRGSAVIGFPDSCFGISISPGDILTTPLPAAFGGISPFPCIVIPAEALALSTLRSGDPLDDDLDALDVSLDCNGNLIPDLLDISYGIAPDANFDSVIDFCCGPESPPAPSVGDDTCFSGSVNTGVPCSTNFDCTAPAVCGLKSRYISITLPAACPPLALRVDIVDMRQCAGGVNAGRGCETNSHCPGSTCIGSPVIGDVWWAGPSGVLPNPPNPALTGAPLRCVPTDVPAPNVQVWPAGTLHLFGAVTLPRASYEVRMCAGAGGPCSVPLMVSTGKWGDVTAPFGGAAQPNFSDINEVVLKFRNLSTSLSMPRVDLVGVGNPGQPNLPNQVANFGDISADVDAFRGFAYPYVPRACP